MGATAGLVLAGARPAMGQPAADGAFDAAGYRRARYRAPVDRDPAPAGTLPLARALRLRPGRDSLFIDVLPAEGARRDPGTGRWDGVPPHQTIPGALWLPETGRAAPDPALWAGLVETVAAARRAHPRWPVVLFCRADCWMSWNAARRLASAGISQVWWQPEGIDGWHDAGRPLAASIPQPPSPSPLSRAADRAAGHGPATGPTQGIIGEPVTPAQSPSHPIPPALPGARPGHRAGPPRREQCCNRP